MASAYFGNITGLDRISARVQFGSSYFGVAAHGNTTERFDGTCVARSYAFRRCAVLPQAAFWACSPPVECEIAVFALRDLRHRAAGARS